MSDEKQEPTNVFEAAARYWADLLEVSDKRDALYTELLARLPKALEDIPHFGIRLDVDYDPFDVLLEAVRATGIECRGMMFSAQGLFPSKTRTMVRRDVTFEVCEGYGAMERIVWPKAGE